MRSHFDDEEMPAEEVKIRLPRDWDNVLKLLDEVNGHEPPKEKLE
ncbi:hypothetical protein MF628_09050 (plasmid) [Paenibacillus polymyxa]|nr:hypothetical protein [Paenibacillus polymyxa]UZP81012.1 hypothetical protein MF628_07845 [Paenibacillus polymyxa]WDZ64289.1 hypothetical protein MF628_09050 [Paenibacillus polymyxa]